VVVVEGLYNSKIIQNSIFPRLGWLKYLPANVQVEHVFTQSCLYSCLVAAVT